MNRGATVLLTLLRSAIHAPEPHQLGALSTDWDEVLALCAHHRVSALAYHGLTLLGPAATVPVAVVETLKDRATSNAMRLLQLSAETEALALAMSERRIPMALLKGMHLAAAVYPARGLREMIDVDVLVQKAEVQTALSVLDQRGYRPIRPFSLDVDMQVAHHATPLRRGRCSFEVHWALAKPSSNLHLSMADVWARMRPLTVGRAACLCLSDEDLLVHLCHHAVASHDLTIGLRPFTDIAVLLTRRQGTIDWSLVHAISRQPHVARAVALMLALTERLFGVNPPAGMFPGRCPDEILAVAEAVAWRDIVRDQTLVNVAQVRENRTWIESVTWMASRFAIPPAVLAKHYGVPVRSRRLPFLYVKRAWELFARYGTAVTRVPKGADAVWHDAAERAIVRGWVSQSD